MQQYEKELQFKNRVLREREKRVFNDAMKQKMSKNNIDTRDLKKGQFLTNHRQSKRHLAGTSQAAILPQQFDILNQPHTMQARGPGNDSWDLEPTYDSQMESIVVTPNTWNPPTNTASEQAATLGDEMGTREQDRR